MNIQFTQVEKGIPVPAGKGGAKPKYPFGSMDIGDSFFVTKAQNAIAAIATGYGKRHAMKFITHSEGCGTRVWRVK